MSNTPFHEVRSSVLVSEAYIPLYCLPDSYECNQVHRYILCVAVVILCNEHWEQGIQKVVFLVALISVSTI